MGKLKHSPFNLQPTHNLGYKVSTPFNIAAYVPRTWIGYFFNFDLINYFKSYCDFSNAIFAGAMGPPRAFIYIYNINTHNIVLLIIA